MSAPWTLAVRDVLLDEDDQAATMLVPPNTAGTLLFGPAGFKIRPFSRAAIVSYAQAWDAAGNNFLTYHLLVNGAKQYPFEDRAFSIAAPYGDTIYLPRMIEIPQLATVNVSVDLTGAAASVNFTARIGIYYFERDPNLLAGIEGSKGLLGAPVNARLF